MCLHLSDSVLSLSCIFLREYIYIYIYILIVVINGIIYIGENIGLDMYVRGR